MIVALSDVGAAMEAPIQYSARFIASAEEGGIVADRPYNTAQQADTMLRYPSVRKVEYSPLDNPTRMVGDEIDCAQWACLAACHADHREQVL
jgi:hypothetical protein